METEVTDSAMQRMGPGCWPAVDFNGGLAEAWLRWLASHTPQSRAASAAIKTSGLCSRTRCVWLGRGLLFRSQTGFQGHGDTSTHPDGSATARWSLRIPENS